MAKVIKQPAYHNGYTRLKPTHGTMYSSNTIHNPLPDIGDVIVIEEIVMVNGIPRYQLATSRMDSWYRPRLYTVLGYTHGQDDIFNPFNKIMCEYNVSGSVLRQDISTLPIVTGSMRTVKASPTNLKMWRYV